MIVLCTSGFTGQSESRRRGDGDLRVTASRPTLSQTMGKNSTMSTYPLLLECVNIDGCNTFVPELHSTEQGSRRADFWHFATLALRKQKGKG